VNKRNVREKGFTASIVHNSQRQGQPQVQPGGKLELRKKRIQQTNFREDGPRNYQLGEISREKKKVGEKIGQANQNLVGIDGDRGPLSWEKSTPA